MTSVYTFSDTELLHQVNYTKGIIIDGLQREGFLTDEQAKDLHTNYSVIVETRSWVPTFLADFIGLKKDSLRVRLVKAIGRERDTPNGA